MARRRGRGGPVGLRCSAGGSQADLPEGDTALSPDHSQVCPGGHTTRDGGINRCRPGLVDHVVLLGVRFATVDSMGETTDVTNTTNTQESKMTEPGNEEQYDDDSQTTAEDAEEDAEDKRINDPLTRSEVKAPRVPFGSPPPPEER